jgi:hypothetical protein
MAIQVQGNGGTVAEVETNTRALRNVLRPLDPGALGSYQMAVTSGLMAAGIATDANILSFRWTSSTSVAVLRSVRMTAFNGGTASAAGTGYFQMFVARSFTGSDSGGTAFTLTTNNGKMKTAFATTAVGDIRASSTAALTAGSRTLDAQPLCSIGITLPITTVNYFFVGPNIELYRPEPTMWPLVMAQNEGFVVQVKMPATGTWGFSFNLAWDEVTAF